MYTKNQKEWASIVEWVDLLYSGRLHVLKCFWMHCQASLWFIEWQGTKTRSFVLDFCMVTFHFVIMWVLIYPYNRFLEFLWSEVWKWWLHRHYTVLLKCTIALLCTGNFIQDFLKKLLGCGGCFACETELELFHLKGLWVKQLLCSLISNFFACVVITW